MIQDMDIDLKKYNSELIAFLEKYEEQDCILCQCVVSSNDILADVFNIIDLDDKDRIINVCLLSTYISCKLNLDTLCCSIASIVYLLIYEFDFSKDYVFKIFREKQIFITEDMESQVLFYVRKRNSSFRKINNNIDLCIIDSIYIYDFFIFGKSDILINSKELDLSHVLCTTEGKLILLYMVFYKEGQITDNKREIICYHYSNADNLESILINGIKKVNHNFVYCTIFHNDIFNSKEKVIFEKLIPRRFISYIYGNLVLKLKLQIDDVLMWMKSESLFGLQILLEEVPASCIIDYRKFELPKLKKIEEGFVSIYDKEYFIDDMEKIFEIGRITNVGHNSHDQIFKCYLDGGSPLLLVLEDIKLFNEISLDSYNIFEIYSNEDFLFSLGFNFSKYFVGNFFIKGNGNSFIKEMHQRPSGGSLHLKRFSILIEKKFFKIHSISNNFYARNIYEEFSFGKEVDNLEFNIGSRTKKTASFSIGSIMIYKVKD